MKIMVKHAVYIAFNRRICLNNIIEKLKSGRFLFVNDVLYLVIPCYNEEAVLYETSKRLLDVINHLVKTEKISSESKIMFVNDGSKDKTWEIIESLHTQNPIFLRCLFIQKQRPPKCIVSRINDRKRIC